MKTNDILTYKIPDINIENPKEESNGDINKTGDSTSLMTFFIIRGISLIGILTKMKRKKNKINMNIKTIIL